jgi:hypothetical protein
MRPCLEKPITKKRAGGVTQGAGPEFNPSTAKKKKKRYHTASILEEQNHGSQP